MNFRVLGVLAALLSGSAAAGDTVWSVHYGDYNDVERIGVSVRLGEFWERQWGNWRGSLRPEIEVSQFSYDGRGSDDDIEQVGAAALFRVVRRVGSVWPYAELGLGGTLLSKTRLGSKSLSTAFQFGEHVGLGLELENGFTAGWRFSHYSNADIAKPNDGIDINQVVIGMRF